MKLLNTNRFYLAGTNKHFVHLATVTYNIREFMCFVDTISQKVYIEEISGGHLEFIEDDSLAQALASFLTEAKILDMTKRLLPLV